MRQRLRSVACLAVLVALPGTVGAQVEGTYRFVLCDGTCTDVNAPDTLATGAFVLFSDSSFLADLTPNVRRELARGGRWIVLELQEANACFRATRRVESVRDRELYVGIVKSGITRWLVDAGLLVVPVYGSPDASFALVGTIQNGRMTGWGDQYDWDGRRGSIGSFVAERVGPPDAQVCRTENRR